MDQIYIKMAVEEQDKRSFKKRSLDFVLYANAELFLCCRRLYFIERK